MLRSLVRTLGELLITAGLVGLLFAAYLLWFTGVHTDGEQAALRDQLAEQWAAEQAPAGAPATSPDVPAAPQTDSLAAQAPAPASPAVTAETRQVARDAGVAVLRVPRFGEKYEWAVVEGVEPEDLKKGPGHYPGTALPGEVGNVVLAGHRTTYGAPFHRYDELRPGDEVSLETGEAIYSYRVSGTTTVEPTAMEVTHPVPGQPDAVPTRQLLTLITCTPKYSARYRLIVTAELAWQEQKRPVAAAPQRASSPVS